MECYIQYFFAYLKIIQESRQEQDLIQREQQQQHEISNREKVVRRRYQQPERPDHGMESGYDSAVSSAHNSVRRKVRYSMNNVMFHALSDVMVVDIVSTYRE